MIDCADYDETLEPDPDETFPCLYCDHWHDPSVSCERNRQEEWMQKAIEEAEERYRDKYKR